MALTSLALILSAVAVAVKTIEIARFGFTLPRNRRYLTVHTMSTDPIKELIYAEEFYPFRIHHKKGRVYDVPHRDFAFVSPVGVFVVIENPDNGHRHMEILNPAMIERITTNAEAETNGD
jgi:hypothetical protein